MTTDVPGCRETVIHGKNGYLVPARSVVPLAEAILSLIRDPARIVAMGVESRRLAESKYDARMVAVEMLRAMRLAPPAGAASPEIHA